VTDEIVVGATPDGWLYEIEEGGQSVISQSYTGQRVDFGDPLQPGVTYDVTIGPDGFLATPNYDGDADGEIVYTPWAFPYRHRILATANQVDDEPDCVTVGSTYAACDLSAGLTLFPVHGGTPTVVAAKCAADFTVLNGEAVWTSAPRTDPPPCHSSRLGEASAAGSVTHSPQNYSPVSIVAALGRLVVLPRDESELITLTSVTATPEVLHRAHVG
jgi:hypothetical protein